MRHRRREEGGALWDALSLLFAAAAVGIAAAAYLVPAMRRFLPAVFLLAAVVNGIYAADCLTPDESHHINKSGAVLGIVLAAVMAGLAAVTGLVFARG